MFQPNYEFYWNIPREQIFSHGLWEALGTKTMVRAQVGKVWLISCCAAIYQPQFSLEWDQIWIYYVWLEDFLESFLILTKFSKKKYILRPKIVIIQDSFSNLLYDLSNQTLQRVIHFFELLCAYSWTLSS